MTRDTLRCRCGFALTAERIEIDAALWSLLEDGRDPIDLHDIAALIDARRELATVPS